MMKKITYLLLISLAVACANKEKKATPSADGGWDITLSGKAGFANPGTITIQELTPADNAKSDSVKAETDGKYSKDLHLTEPGYYRINFFGKQEIDLVLDKSNVEVNVDSTGNVEIKGSPDYDLIREVRSQLMAFDSLPEVQQLQKEFQVAAQSRQDAKVKELRGRYLDIMMDDRDKIMKKLETKPVSLALINLLSGDTFDKDKYYEYYKKVAADASAKWPNSVHIKEFKNMVDKMAITAIGQKAPEISLPDPNGKIVTLSSFKGKYVLVDFWAKWCGPCRAENPNVVAAYKEFHKDGFEILGVSLDRSKEDWVAAIKQDGLTWTQVSDLKYFESQAALDYNINAIPFSILVDPNGIIVAKNLRDAKLQRKLKEVYKK